MKAELKNKTTQTLIEIGKSKLKDSLLLKVFDKKLWTCKKDKLLHTEHPGDDEMHIKE